MPGSGSASPGSAGSPGGPGVAVCGLGPLGRAVAGRLVAAGLAVTVWNRHRREVPGATVAATAAEAAAAGVVITLLAGPEAVEEVVLGPSGVAAGGPDVLVQMSTVAPADVLALRSRLPAGVGLLDAPVLGSGAQAAAGTLRILAGGDAGTVARCRPVLDPLGETVHIGPVPTGSAVKQVVNAAVAPMVALLAEAVALADRLGLDRTAVLDELVRSRIGPLVERKRAMIETGDYPPAATLAAFHRDMALVERTAGDLPMTMAAAARLRAEAALAAGLGDRDYSVLVAHALRTDPGCG